MENRNYYAIIPANVRYDEELTPNAKLLYGEITSLCNETGTCWATNKYFAQLYNVSDISISKWINQLVKKGYLHSEIEYAEGSKQILNRYLRIVYDPIKEKFNTPIKEKFKENNTIINNTNEYKENNIKEKNIDLVKDIFDYWNTKNIIKHSKLNQDRKNAINKALKKYTFEEIKTCIDNYSKVLNDKNFFFNYKWSLEDFLNRKNGISSFTNDGSIYQNYLNKTTNNINNANNNESLDYVFTDLDNINLG